MVNFLLAIVSIVTIVIPNNKLFFDLRYFCESVLFTGHFACRFLCHFWVEIIEIEIFSKSTFSTFFNINCNFINIILQLNLY
jgi:hypothetical protein